MIILRQKNRGDNMLVVRFYYLEGDKRGWQGYYMPSQDFFEKEYVPQHHPDAKDIGDGKYQIDEYRYIKCEEE